MMTNNPVQLKAYIKKAASDKSLPAQLVLQSYMMELLLEWIWIKKYMNKEADFMGSIHERKEYPSPFPCRNSFTQDLGSFLLVDHISAQVDTVIPQFFSGSERSDPSSSHYRKLR